MAFFTSEHECRLDAKGRLVLPSRLKSVLPEASKKSIIIRKGFEPNLIIYSLHEFQNIYTRINSLNEFSSEQRKLKRKKEKGKAKEKEKATECTTPLHQHFAIFHLPSSRWEATTKELQQRFALPFSLRGPPSRSEPKSAHEGRKRERSDSDRRGT